MENLEDYKYRLQYFHKGVEVTHEFPAGISAERLVLELRNFLCGCSWGEDTVKEMLNLEE